MNEAQAAGRPVPRGGPSRARGGRDPALVPLFGSRTHPGLVRARNEDQYAVIRHDRRAEIVATSLPSPEEPPVVEQAYLFLVGDGLGGAAFGDVASAAALRMVWEMGVAEEFWPTQDGEQALRILRERGTRYVERIHEALTEHAKSDPAYRGMGTTITAAYAFGNRCFLTYVGDSRAYRIRGDRVLQVTKDHTVRQRLEDDGVAVDDPGAFGHILTNCLGGNMTPARPDFNAFRLARGDAVVLCTDGLSDVVEAREIHECVAKAEHPQAACDALVDLALERGGPDNVTVVVASFRPRTPPPGDG